PRASGGDQGGVPPLGGLVPPVAHEVHELLLSQRQRLARDDLLHGSTRGGLREFRVRQRDSAGGALPPPLARGSAPLHLADEVVTCECAQVVAGGSRGLARQRGQSAGRLSPVLAEQVEQTHP
ncbi:Fanconi anemia group I-like protein, partial [Corchorus olitorius]